MKNTKRRNKTNNKNRSTKEVAVDLSEKVIKHYGIKGLCIVMAVLLVCLAIGGVYYHFFYKKPQVTTAMSIHFLELGNKYTGDCTYIKVGENIDILVDCGSRANSLPTITDYLDDYVTDGVLDFVIITHAHQDHYAGFCVVSDSGSLFDKYYCDTIIKFAQIESGKESTSMYQNFVSELATAKASPTTNSKIYTAEECINEENGAKSNYDLDSANHISLQILDSYYYTHRSSNENNHSVCFMINQGSNNFLFTGDLESDGEEHLIEMNDLPKVEMVKASHHGSYTGVSDSYLEKILDPNNPAIVPVTCVAGSNEYTNDDQNQFPSKTFIDRISIYTTLVYVTSMSIDYTNGVYSSFNGNIVLTIETDKSISVNCSSNNIVLKDSAWFKVNRYDMCVSSMASSWR